ncbi:MAG: RNA methyltransferase [Bdellovibrionales bacterium]|nr:RNA methyltransferase [Bdellovibrionales bacterium]
MSNDSSDSASLLEQFLLPERLERLESVLAARSDTLTVVLDRIRNAHNVSAILRSADAFGLTEVHLVGDTFQHSRGISMGTERWMRLRGHQSPDAAIAALQADGFRIAVLRPEQQSETGPKPLPVTALPFQEKLALVFGNELRGVDDRFTDAADIHAFIPMRGFVESLNVSVACAICLFCSTIAPTSPARRTPTLSEDKRRLLRDDWLRAGVRHADVILTELKARQEVE